MIELAGDAQFSRDLSAGGVFVSGCTLRLSEECDLVVCGANDQIVVPARVVYVDEQRGAGLELMGFSAEMKAQLAELEPVAPQELEFLDDPALDGSPLDGPVPDEPQAEDDAALGGANELVPLIELEALDDAGDDDDAIDAADAAGAGGDTYRGAYTDAATYATSTDADADADEIAAYVGDTNANLTAAATLPPRAAAGRDHEDDGDGDPAEPGRVTHRFALTVHERLRGLPLAAQLKVAVGGELHERIVLERLYGKNVWETLLRNPRLTAPEVSRIARYGSLPRVLLEIIVGNNAWLQIPEVRRALLSNPRLATDQIMKVLRLTPKHELKLAAIQTAYPHTVRNAAKLVLDDD